MELSIIVVNWNSADFTIGCIDSIQAHTSGIEYEIVVVDNASEGESWRDVAIRFPFVNLIRSETNLGFARANNLGASHARGSMLLFLNPDTIVLDNTIRIMTTRLDRSSGVAAIGCRILNRDFSLQDCVQHFPTITNQLFASRALTRRRPVPQLADADTPMSRASRWTSDVEVIPGACLMIDREVFEEVGCFSTEYFMYAEEVDLCFKIGRAGWRLCRADDAQIIHYGGESTKQRGDSFSHIVMRESVFRLLQKFRGNGYAFFYRMAVFVSALLRLAALLLLMVLPRALVDRNDIEWSYNKWRKIAHWCLSGDVWTEHVGLKTIRL